MPVLNGPRLPQSRKSKANYMIFAVLAHFKATCTLQDAVLLPLAGLEGTCIPARPLFGKYTLQFSGDAKKRTFTI